MIITICGSMRYQMQIFQVYRKLSLDGNAVFLPVFMPDPAKAALCRDKLREIHLNKIALSDAICVVCPDNYIGDDTRYEIEFAKKFGKYVFVTKGNENG